MTQEQLSPEWELIQKIVSQYGNAVAMPFFEQWVKDYAAMKAQPLVDLLKVLRLGVPEGHNAEKAIASALASYAGSAEGEKERPCNPTPDSDALMEPPSFEQMVGLIKKNFRDVLELSGIKDEGRIAKAWERYKCLNHLYRDGEPEKKDPWISVEDQPLVIDTKLGWECTEAGEGEFLAAIQVHDNSTNKDHWWIRHCVIEDMIGLCVVGDDENTPAGWDVKDVQYYWPLPEPPAATNQEGV